MMNEAFFNEFDCHQYNFDYFSFLYSYIFFNNYHAEYLCTLSLPNMIKIILPKMQFECLISIADLDLHHFLNKTL